MPTPTYSPIATQTLTGAQSSITFNSFSGYTDLVLVYTAKVSTAADLSIYFNGVTGTSYSTVYLSGNGSSPASARSSNAGAIFLDYYGYADTTNFNVAIYHIMNYSNTSTYKSIIGRSNNAAVGTDGVAGTYRSTNAITSLTVDPVGSMNLSIGSTFTLYGILAA